MLAFDWLAGNRWRGGGERPHSFFPQPKPNLSCFCPLWDFENVPKLADTMNVTLGDILLAQTVFKTARETVWRHQGSGAPGRDVTYRRGGGMNCVFVIYAMIKTKHCTIRDHNMCSIGICQLCISFHQPSYFCQCHIPDTFYGTKWMNPDHKLNFLKAWNLP